MWSQKNKGDKPHYKPGTDKKYKKYQNEEASYKTRDKALKKSKKAMDFRHQNIHKGGDDPDVNESSYEKLKKKIGSKKMHKEPVVVEGIGDVVKKGVKRHKDAVEKKKIKNRKAVPYAALGASYQPEGEVVLEKDLNAAERRALPDKDFVFPGKGEGPKGKQRGAYPIPDKKHARNALAMAAAHASPEKQAKVKAAVKKKYPDIEVSEATLMDKIKKWRGKKKKEKKASMDKTTEKLHDWRHKNSPEQKEREKYVSFTRPIVKEAKAEKKKGRHPRDQKELDRAEDFIKKNPNFGKVSEDKAFEFVKNQLKKKYGDGVLTKGDKIKPPTAAQKKAAAAHREKVAKQQAAEFKKDPSQGRYPPGYSNRGSD
jgi:hypothetical protein